MTRPVIPDGVKIRVVGDVHGDRTAFAYATATDRFIIQLGDLIDHGPDSAGTLRIMFDLIESHRGLFLLGNHDLKLGRALAGDHVRTEPVVQATIGQLDDTLKERAIRHIAEAPAWVRLRSLLFVHGGFHTVMLDQPAPNHGLEPTGRIQPDGYPERSLRWVDRIPEGMTVYCGHDRRSTDGRPYIRHGALGGIAVFLDTGAGKGGHLSWIDLP
jgi:3',5'-cyclic AMP phosphodiesterase CpdA